MSSRRHTTCQAMMFHGGYTMNHIICYVSQLRRIYTGDILSSRVERRKNNSIANINLLHIGGSRLTSK